MERFRYDRSSKWMIEHHGDAILRIGGIRDILSWRPRPAEVVQPRQMPDGLLEVRRANDDRFYPYIIEIETYPKTETAAKLLDDIVMVWQARGVVPDVIVLVLQPKAHVQVADSDEVISHSGLTSVRGRWHIVRLWEVPAADLLATGDAGVMPWVLLSHIHGPPEPVLQECRRIIDVASRPEESANLLAVSQVLGGLRYNAAMLGTIFGGKEKMIESPVLRELIAEQRAEQRVQTQHEDILGVLDARFGPTPNDLRATLLRITDATRLRELIRQAALSADLEAFRRHLAP